MILILQMAQDNLDKPPKIIKIMMDLNIVPPCQTGQLQGKLTYEKRLLMKFPDNQPILYLWSIVGISNRVWSNLCAL